MVVSGSSDQTLRVWDVKDGANVAVFSEWGEIGSGLSTAAVTSCAFSADCQRIAAGGHRVAKVWRLSDAPAYTQPAPKDKIESCLVGPNRKTFLILRHCQPPIEVCDAETGQPIRSLGHSRPGLSSVCFHLHTTGRFDTIR